MCPKVSVIIPVYKAEKYLKRCVESVINQTVSDLEIILVDDGSPDDCPVMCDAYAVEDSRIKVIHKSNGGVSTARNAGLDAATGEYITFVDSDDYVEPDMYERMLSKAHEYDCDVIMCDCVKEFQDYSELYTHDIRGGFYDCSQLRNEYYPHLLIMENIKYPATISNCTLLWKNEYNISSMRYEAGIRFSEDLLFGAKLMRKAKSFFYMKGQAFYHYVMNPDSASHSYVPDKWNDYQRLHNLIKEQFVDDSEFDFNHQIDFCLLFFLYNTIGEIYGTNLSLKDKKLKILNILLTTDVVRMFGRLKIGKLRVSNKLKLITLFYKYQIGLSILIAYYERKYSIDDIESDSDSK